MEQSLNKFDIQSVVGRNFNIVSSLTSLVGTASLMAISSFEENNIPEREKEYYCDGYIKDFIINSLTTTYTMTYNHHVGQIGSEATDAQISMELSKSIMEIDSLINLFILLDIDISDTYFEPLDKLKQLAEQYASKA